MVWGGFDRVPQGFYKGSTRPHKGCTNDLQGLVVCLEGSNVSCDCRLRSHRGSKLRAQNNLLMGGTLSKTEINGFQHTFTVLTCSRCSPCSTWWALGSKRSTRLRGLRGKVPKTLHEVSTRFCKSYGVALRKGSNKVSR